MRIFSLAFLLCSASFSYGQIEDFPQREAERILNFLASDSLKGRGNLTEELSKAAYFIENEFKKDSLGFLPGLRSYLQPFALHELNEAEKQKGFLSSQILFNVVGVLPGNKKPGEAIVFSAHYDHIGTFAGGRDTIYNGANDNASGTTALLMLAHYFAIKKDNVRTLIFCAFSGEELGLEGSNVFVNTVDCKNIIAGVNIEMIGATNVSGKNAFFITGEYLSNLGRIMRRNLKGTSCKVVREPNEKKMLFQRSDNYSFAKMGIPVHSIMCSDDDDPCYHKVCDEIKRIDIKNMVNVMKAISIGISSIVQGEDKPWRLLGY
jgi:hypothetical protein